jgi:hypothetical protein
MNAYSGLIWTLRNLTTPDVSTTPMPCWSAIRPEANLSEWALSTVFWPLRINRVVRSTADNGQCNGNEECHADFERVSHVRPPVAAISSDQESLTPLMIVSELHQDGALSVPH